MPTKWIRYPKDSPSESEVWLEELNDQLEKEKGKSPPELFKRTPYKYILVTREGVRYAMMTYMENPRRISTEPSGRLSSKQDLPEGLELMDEDERDTEVNLDDLKAITEGRR